MAEWNSFRFFSSAAAAEVQKLTRMAGLFFLGSLFLLGYTFFVKPGFVTPDKPPVLPEVQASVEFLTATASANVVPGRICIRNTSGQPVTITQMITHCSCLTFIPETPQVIENQQTYCVDFEFQIPNPFPPVQIHYQQEDKPSLLELSAQSPSENGSDEYISP